MTPAVKRALIYCAITGRLPSHIHMGTWSAAYALVDQVPYRNKELGLDLHRNQVQPAALAALAGDPYMIACQWFLAQGFRPERASSGRANTSHYIAFTHGGFVPWSVQGLAYRQGGGSVTVQHDERPFVTRLTLAEAEAAWPAICDPAKVAGAKASYETGNAYLARAMAALA